MTLYFGNNEVSQKVLLSTVGSNLPEITTETSGKILSNNGTELEWVDKPSGKIIGSFGYTLDEVAPDGCVFCDGSEYEKAKFPDFYQSLVDNKRKSVDYATFNSSVSTNGSCGFFGLESTVITLYAWEDRDYIIYTKSENPLVGDSIFDNVGNKRGTITVYDGGQYIEDVNFSSNISLLAPEPGVYTRSQSSDITINGEYTGKFKVPMLKDVYLKAGQEPVIFGGESLPNITGDFQCRTGNIANGAFSNTKSGVGQAYWANADNDSPYNVSFNASNSSEIYQDSAKVNPDYVAYKVFVVIYNAETEISESQTSEFLNTVNEINNKLNNQKTNCITKIPQDIKLELSDGVLTLKAGSKVYVPNGVGIFDELVIQEDKTALSSGAEGKVFLFVRDNGLDVYCNQSVGEAVSGTTPPTFKGLFYNTNENKIYFYDNSTVADKGFSLPIAVLTSSAGNITSIDQVFNGFGYIGSTIFALPNVEGLMPNGRNADGSLNNTKFTTTNVLTYTPTTGTYNVLLTLTSDRFYWNSSARYDAENNYNINDAGIIPQLILGYSKVVSGRITSFNPKTTFQAVDRNDTEWASTASKPSKKYTNINLTASGTKLIMPDNGFIYCIVDSVANSRLAMYDSDFPYRNIFQIPNTNAGRIGGGLLVKKGDSITIDYSGTIVNCIFTYDEGSK